MIYDDYIAYHNTYKEKYGDKCVVFIQVGDFFELYAVQQEKGLIGADIYKVCDLCNIQVSRKNKSLIENTPQNPLMAGFPLQAISKFIQILIQHQYTIVLIRQVTPPPNPKREVTEIISPSTYMNVSSQEGCYLMTIYWEDNSVGLSCLDMTVGTSYVYEAYSTMEDPQFAMDEIVRWIQMFQPKEVLIMGLQRHKDVIDRVNQAPKVHQQWGYLFQKLYLQPSYQNAVLEKVFPHKGLITPIEVLGLERTPLASVAFCAMIQFAYEHNTQLVYRIEKPSFLENDTHLILESNSIQQLNILSQQPNEKSLLYLLNRCATAFGSRLFKERLLNPWIQASSLNKSYDQIDYYRDSNRYDTVLQRLSNVMDLERLLRKIAIGTLMPSEWSLIQLSLDACESVYHYLQKTTELEWIQSIRQGYQSLNLEECQKYNLSDIYGSLFQKGIYTDLDDLSERIETSQTTLKQIAEAISRIGEGDSTLCRLDYNDRDGYFLTMTKKRWEMIEKLKVKTMDINTKTIVLNQCKVKPISSSSSMVRITHAWLEELSDRMLSDQRRISNLNIKYYKDFLNSYDEKYHTIWLSLIRDIAEMDVYATHARNSKEYGYVRPVLESSKESYVQMVEMRHPIIERLNQSCHYVSNDVTLGKEKHGLLLYGINAAGKSSLMKAVGLNVLMAQAGMFVPCTSMVLSPYHHMFTRIMTQDNIYRGHSTFTVEMLELKNILNRCDGHSLVLGDELCSGTESISATAIVSAGIHCLLERNVSFVFATHLHELADVSFIRNHPKLWVAHIHIEMDPTTGKIIYDRRLNEGRGSSLYGIEVCRSLRLPMDFLKFANQVRQEIQEGTLYMVEPKVSKYNGSVIVSTCQLCGQPAKETHHIQPQKNGNPRGLLHTRSNLLVLCEQCHLNQHHGGTVVNQYIQTSEGVEISYEEKKKRDEGLTLHTYLKYTMDGWMFRLTKRHKWKPLTNKNYNEMALALYKYDSELPDDYSTFEKYSEEKQSEFFVLG